MLALQLPLLNVTHNCCALCCMTQFKLTCSLYENMTHCLHVARGYHITIKTYARYISVNRRCLE